MKMNAQSRTGITNKPDTSYTTYSAYNYSKADNPQIKIVEAFNYLYAKGIIYYYDIPKRLLNDKGDGVDLGQFLSTYEICI